MVPPPSPPAPYHLFAGAKWIRTLGPPYDAPPPEARRGGRAAPAIIGLRGAIAHLSVPALGFCDEGDSPLEQEGFEPSVPQARYLLKKHNCLLSRGCVEIGRA